MKFGRTPAQKLLICLALILPIMLGTALNAQGREPSTPEERAEVVRLTKASELDLMIGTSEQERAWFMKLMVDVPDIKLELGPVAIWCSESMQEDKQALALFQFMLSAVSFQIENPTKTKDSEAIDLAGLEGVISAYENLCNKNQNARSIKMDEAIILRNNGGLPGFVKQLRSNN